MKTFILNNVFLLPFVFFLNLTFTSNQSNNKYGRDHNNFVPDTTVNQKMKLANSNSILNSMPSLKDHNIQNDCIFMYNMNASEIVVLNLGYGGKNNEVLYFDVFYEQEFGLLKDMKYLKVDRKQFVSTKYKNFASESNIRLGITRKEITNIKGENYKYDKKAGYEILTYEITMPSPFLKRYNMSAYKATYYFNRHNKLVRFSYGFIQP